MNPPPDWIEFFGLFQSNGVRFLVVGAHALAANGRPRATQDIDVWIEPTPENAQRVCAALSEFGLGDLTGSAAEFATVDRMATIGRPPLRIDVMTSITGVEFAWAWDGRVEAEFGGVLVPFLGRAALIQNKRATGRVKDLLDIELLLEGDD